MKVSERNVLDRRSFVKAMLAAGATVTVAACAPVAAPSGPAPAAVVGVAGPAWIHPKSLVRPMPGYGGAHLTWKYGDTVKWLPPEKYPADAAADTLAKVPKADLEAVYSRMWRIRFFETMNKDVNLRGWKDTVKAGVVSPGHIRIGEEAIPTGIRLALRAGDMMFTTHAGHHDLLAWGCELNPMEAEFYAKTTGYQKGHGGYMHVTVPSLGVLGANGIVGAAPPLAAGAAWAAKVEKAGKVAVAFLGDQATNSRHFFNHVRHSANHKLPAIFVIQNNFYGVSGPVAVNCPSPYLADYATGVGLPTVVVDGNNLGQVYSAAKDAVERARAGEGPTVIECITFRWYDHAGVAGAKAGVDAAWGLPYRTDDEVRAWMSRDPIVRYGAWLVLKGFFTQAQLDAIRDTAKRDVEASHDFAAASPEPRGEDGGYNHEAIRNPVPATQFFEHAVIK